MDQQSEITQEPGPIEKRFLFRQIKQLREKDSRLVKIIVLLVIIFIITVIGFSSYFAYDKFYDTPTRENISNLTYDITKDIVKPPITVSNEIESKKRLIDSRPAGSYTAAQLDQISGTLYPDYSKQLAKYGEDEFTIQYWSEDEKGQSLKIKAQVFVPKGAAGEKFPLFVFGQGTTGLGDQCAPSMERPSVSNWGNYYNHLRTYAGQGFITVFPDYEGFNDPNRVHHYFNARLEAQVLLDGTRAVMEMLSEQVQPAAFYAGYSQGGHAAFAVKDYQPTYAPDVPIRGVIGFGATTNIINLVKENPDLAPYLFYSYADFYGRDKVKFSDLMAERWLPTYEQDVLGKCVSAVPSYYTKDASRVYSEKFNNALFNNKLEQEFPELYKMFIENSTGLKKSDLPSLLIQGDPDPIVTVKSQEEFVKQACGIGSNITYNRYQGVHHFQTRHVSFKDVSSWMRNILAGQKPESICTHLQDLGQSVRGAAAVDLNQLKKIVPPPPGGR